METNTKTCKRCAVPKLFSEYKKNKENRDGLDTTCKTCRNELWRVWYYAKDQTDRKKKQRDYDKKNRKSRDKVNKEWKLKNPEKVAEYEKTCRKRTNIKIRLRSRARRYKIKDGKVTQEDIRDLFKLQNNTCPYCPKDISKEYNIDHILPLSRGGLHEKANIQLTCPKCNLSKATKTHEEFIEWLKSYVWR